MEALAFAGITRNVIANEGFDDFLPVACFPERGEIRALEGVPSSKDLEGEVLRWAAALRNNASEEFLVAFKCSASHFKIVRVIGGQDEHHVFDAKA